MIGPLLFPTHTPFNPYSFWCASLATPCPTPSTCANLHSDSTPLLPREITTCSSSGWSNAIHSYAPRVPEGLRDVVGRIGSMDAMMLPHAVCDDPGDESLESNTKGLLRMPLSPRRNAITPADRDSQESDVSSDESRDLSRHSSFLAVVCTGCDWGLGGAVGRGGKRVGRLSDCLPRVRRACATRKGIVPGHPTTNMRRLWSFMRTGDASCLHLSGCCDVSSARCTGSCGKTVCRSPGLCAVFLPRTPRRMPSPRVSRPHAAPCFPPCTHLLFSKLGSDIKGR